MKLLAHNERKGEFTNNNGETVKWRTYDLIFADGYSTRVEKCNADQIDKALKGHQLNELYGHDINLYQNLFSKAYIIQENK